MLHNTGPYGPNETPVNMGAPKMPNLASPMNIAPNFNNFVKMSQQTSHPSSGHFNLQNYVGYAGTTISSSPQMSMFPNDIQTNSSTAHSTDYYSNPVRHSGSLLDNMYNNEDCQKAIDFSNIQQNGSLLQNIYNNEDCQKAVDFSNITNSFKVRERPEVHKPTFSIVEMSNFLAPSSNSTDKYSDFNTNYSKSEVTSEKTDVTKDSYENRYNNVESRVSNAEDNSSDGEYSSNDSIKSDDQNNKLNYLKNTENEQNSSEHEDSDEESINASENDDALTKVVPLTKDRSEDDKDSDSNDERPLNLVHFIKQEPSDNEIPKTNVVVKIEQISSWTDTDHKQPFLKDMNGDLRDDSSLRSIVDGDYSVAEAMEIVKNGMKTDVSFECPSCCLIFSHPKRFLIHTKWHSFGLVNERRVEDAKEKMACRKQKKEMQKEMQDIMKKEAAKVKAEVKAAQEMFDCKNCDKKFNTKSKLRNHRHKFHPSREHECKVCQKKVLGWFGLQTHMATHGGDAVNGYECQVCHKRFKHSHSLAKHRDTHLEKTHGCAECPKKFGSQTLLKIHMRSHERTQRGRTFRCSYCGKGFYEAYTLQYHERTHRNERPFKCDICETSYGTNSSLKRHIKVSHSQAKPYECETCRRCFATELIRDRHAAREHGTPGQLKYACTHCTSRYLRHKDLQRHMYRIHPKGKKRRKQSESE